MRKRWSKEEVIEFIELYPDTDNDVLAKRFNTTIHKVTQKAYAIKVKKSLMFISNLNFKKGERLQKSGASYRFKENRVPHNKGVPMTEEMKDKIRKVFFKSNRKPHNTKDGAGHISIRRHGERRYKYIKIKDSVWVLLHRNVWESLHGAIPPKHIVAFKDRDSLNCKPENLELISMKENRARNGGGELLTDKTIAAYIARKGRTVNSELRDSLLEYPEIIDLKRNEIKLKRLIKNG